MQIKEHQVKRHQRIGKGLEGLPAVLRKHPRAAKLVEQALHELLVNNVVFDEKNSHAHPLVLAHDLGDRDLGLDAKNQRGEGFVPERLVDDRPEPLSKFSPEVTGQRHGDQRDRLVPGDERIGIGPGNLSPSQLVVQVDDGNRPLERGELGYLPRLDRDATPALA